LRYVRGAQLAHRAREMRRDRAQRPLQARRAASPDVALARDSVLRRGAPRVRLRARAPWGLALAVPPATAVKRPGRMSAALPALIFGGAHFVDAVVVAGAGVSLTGAAGAGEGVARSGRSMSSCTVQKDRKSTRLNS